MITLSSIIIFLTHYSFASTHFLCAVIGKYIIHTFLYIIDIIEHYMYYFYACFSNQLRGELRKICFYSVFYNYILTFSNVLRLYDFKLPYPVLAFTQGIFSSISCKATNIFCLI